MSTRGSHRETCRATDAPSASSPKSQNTIKDLRKAAGAKRAKREKEDDNVLGLAEDIDSYRPRSKETRAAYEDLLSFVAQQLGDQPHGTPARGRGGRKHPRRAAEPGRGGTDRRWWSPSMGRIPSSPTRASW